jgi:ribosomal protein S18 acetylase RimI-like enzyme
MSSKIRAATRNDIDAVLRLALDWVAEEITWGQQAMAHDYLEAKIGRYFLVAEMAGKIVGYAIGEVVTKHLAVFQGDLYLNIEEIYVAPAKRGHRIGSALLMELMKSAEEVDVHQFHVFSSTKDQDRITSFYEHNGFRVWGTQFYRES